MISIERMNRETIKYLLEEQNLVYNENLPKLELIKDIRTKEEVVNRINVLHILYTIGEDESEECFNFFRDKLIEKNWVTYLSEVEKETIFKTKLSEYDLLNFSWKKEAMLALMWLINLPRINLLEIKETQVSNYYDLLPPEMTMEQFYESAQIKDLHEVVGFLDYYYCIHSAIRNRDGKGKTSVEQSIIIERRRALEWLTNLELDWDSISLDT